MLAAICCGVGVLLPLAYLIIRAGQAEVDTLADLLWRGDRLARNSGLLLNTVLLAASVWAIVSTLAFPAAWLTVRYALPARRLFTVLLVLPLAVPSYLVAYTLRAVGGPYGSAARFLGVELPLIGGFWGALISLSVYLFPYMFLNLRASVLRLDPSLEESAASLGAGRVRIAVRVILPQLLAGWLAGGLLVVLHVIGDLGVVYFMQYETLSYVLYQQYGAFEQVYGACIALMLMSLAVVVIGAEMMLLRGIRQQRVGAGAVRRVARKKMQWWTFATIALLVGFIGLGVIVPVGTMMFWATQTPMTGLSIEVMPALWNSVRLSLPAAIVATSLALPIGFLAVRYPSRLSRILERLTYVGYATPPLAFALGLVFFSIRYANGLRDTIWLLVYAYSLHFLAEAVGPVRNAILAARVRLEEMSRSLGIGRARTFWHVTLPLIRVGIVVGLVFVFLSAMKELPMTALLQPLDFSTLAYNVWDATNEGDFAAAAPHALTIVGFSVLFVSFVLFRDKEIE